MLNKAYYNPIEDGYLVGAACHQQTQAATPVWVVTDLLGNILFSNQTKREVKNTETNVTTLEPIWALTRGRITVSRFFAASTATIVCQCENISMSDSFPDLPVPARNPVKPIQERIGVLAPDGGPFILESPQENNGIFSYGLDKGDEICIWTGYITGIRDITPEDLEQGRLLRTFVGAIDTLVFSGTSNQGVQLLIQCRDRMKYLMDSVSTFNTTDFLPIGSNLSGKPDSAGKTVEVSPDFDPNEISRIDVILELARRSIGHLEKSTSLSTGGLNTVCGSVCGARITKGYVEDLQNPIGVTVSSSLFRVYGVDKDGQSMPLADLQTPLSYSGLTNRNDIVSLDEVPAKSPFDINNKIPFLGGNTKPSNTDLMGDSNSPASSILALDMSFNIITGRMPFALQGTRQNFFGNAPQITDRVPVEYIKFISLQEPWPTEFFCDHRSGEFWYAPRGLDVSGLNDPSRFFRTYFFRKAPDNFYKAVGGDALHTATSINGKSTVHEAQSILLYREESSVINWRSNIIVMTQPLSQAGSAQGVHIKLNPPWLQGRKFPCSYFVAVDNSIADNISELIATAMTFARIHGKELKAATMHIVGDPSLTPGEAVQIIGSPFHGGGFNTVGDEDKEEEWKVDRNKLTEYLFGYSVLYQNLNWAIKNPTATTPNYPVKSNSNNPITQPDPTQYKLASEITQTGDNISSQDITSLSYAQLQCPAQFSPANTANQPKSTNPDSTPTDSQKLVTDNIVQFPEDPKTIWRVEAFIHKFNENPGDGFRTEVALLAPF